MSAISTVRKWVPLKSDEVFAGLFANAKITEATTSRPADSDYLDGDMYWYLSDGTVLAMQITDLGSGCDTCGYGGGVEKEFYMLDAK